MAIPDKIQALVTQGNDQPLKVANVSFDADKLGPLEVLVSTTSENLCYPEPFSDVEV